MKHLASKINGGHMSTKRERLARERVEAAERITSWGVRPGSRLYTISRHTSRSGLTRWIDVLVSTDGGVVSIGPDASTLLGWQWDHRKSGVKVDGCGMDMGFHLVYSLSRALYMSGYRCPGEECMSGDHVNAQYVGAERVAGPLSRDGQMEHTDGYALRQAWL